MYYYWTTDIEIRTSRLFGFEDIYIGVTTTITKLLNVPKAEVAGAPYRRTPAKGERRSSWAACERRAGEAAQHCAQSCKAAKVH